MAAVAYFTVEMSCQHLASLKAEASARDMPSPRARVNRNRAGSLAIEQH
jgi:hypothetical protein